MLNYWSREGFTGTHRETVPCPHMLAEVIRRLQESKMEPTTIVFEEALKIVKAEVKLGLSFTTQELAVEFTPAHGSGRKTCPMKKPAGAAPATPKSGIYHHIRDEFDSPETPEMDGTSSGTQWSRRDAQRRINGIHGDNIVEICEHESTENNKQTKCVSEMVVEPTRVTGVDKVEEIDKGTTLAPQADGERRVRKVGMNLAATLLFTFSHLYRDWNRSNFFNPYLDVLNAFCVDALEVGGHSVSVDETSKPKGLPYCVNQRTGYDLHRRSDAKKAAEWVTEHRPRVAWFRRPCCYCDGCNNEKTLSGRRKERRLIQNCVALRRILCCVGTDIVWIWPRNTHRWSDQSMSQVVTMLPHHVRIDGCSCGLRESTKGDWA